MVHHKNAYFTIVLIYIPSLILVLQIRIIMMIHLCE
jgi:hypothetical protein